MKKIYVATGGVLIILLFVALFFFMHGTAKGPNKSSSFTNNSTHFNLPASVKEASLTDSSLRFLDINTGNFAVINVSTGQQQEYGPYLIDSQKVTWSPDGKSAVAISGEDESVSVIQIDKNSQVTNSAAGVGNITNSFGVIVPLNNQVHTPDWSSDSKQLLYQFINSNSGKSTITVANADGSNWQSIVDAPTVFSSLWWSPIGTYAIGLNTTTNPSQYDIVAISSKTIKKLITGGNDLRWSPSGKLALLDSTDGSALIIADVTNGSTTSVAVPAQVRQFAWLDETHLVGVSNGKFITIDLATKQSKAFGDAGQLNEFAQVLGIYKDTLFYTQDGAVLSVPITK